MLTLLQAAAEAKHGYEAGLEARENARRGILKFGRDNGRTPVQWTSGWHAGFSDTPGDCWIGVHHNCNEGINVADQQNDPDSIWQFWRKHLYLRKAYRSVLMHSKSFEILDPDNRNSFTFIKRAENGQTALIALNFSKKEEAVTLPRNSERDRHFHFLTGNYGKPAQEFSALRAWEGRVYLAQAAVCEEVPAMNPVRSMQKLSL